MIAADDQAERDLVAAIHTRRVIKCRVNDNHTGPGCQNCAAE